MDKIYDLIIIGSGPAGLSAAIYAERARLETLVLEKEYISGGQVVNTYEVDNYPGFPGVNGYELGMKLRQHADSLGAKFTIAAVNHIKIEAPCGCPESVDNNIEVKVKKIETDQGDFYSKTVIIATGARHRELGVKGEKELAGMGVSYCATCDGAFFKDRVVAVVGGGDVAVEDAIFLARGCEKVCLIHRRDELRAAKSLQEKLFSYNNVEIIWDTEVFEICGEDHVEAVKIQNKKTNEKKILHLDGIFIAVGTSPNSELAEKLIEVNEQGYIHAEENCETNVTGIFAAGDVRTKMLRQIITAAADGANAVSSVQSHLLLQ